MVLESFHENPELSTRWILNNMEYVVIVLYGKYYMINSCTTCSEFAGSFVKLFCAEKNLCRWLSNLPAENRFFISNILFTDEVSFTRNGINNFHTIHVWAEENPHAVLAWGHQNRFSLNVWGGTFKDKMLGPVYLPGRLNGQSYLGFILNTLPELLDDIPLAQRQKCGLCMVVLLYISQ